MPVPPSSGQTLTDQLFFRLGGRVPVTFCLDYINRAMSIIDGASSYVWNLRTAITVIGTNFLDLAIFDPQINIGASIELANTNGILIARTTEDSALRSQIPQYVGINPSVFNNWYLQRSNVGGPPGVIVLTPNIGPLSIQIAYCILPPVLAYGPTPTVMWTQQWMDDLVVDFAEVELKRILNFGGWEELEKRCLAKLQDARTMFSAQRQDTGPLEESQLGQSGA